MLSKRIKVYSFLLSFCLVILFLASNSWGDVNPPPNPSPTWIPTITLPKDSTFTICTGDAVCFVIQASDPDGDTITVSKVSGPGTYTPVTAVSSIIDTFCYVPTSSGVHTWIFKVTDDNGNSKRDTLKYTITIDIPAKMFVNGSLLQTPLAACMQDVLVDFCIGKQEWKLLAEFTPWDGVNRFGYYTGIGTGSGKVVVFRGPDSPVAKETTLSLKTLQRDFGF